MLEEEVRRARREERDVEDLTVEGECLAGADLSGLEFRRVRLHRCRFQNCDFSGRSLTGWSGAAATSPTAASAGRSGRTRWCGTARGRRPVHRQPVAGCTLGESAFRCANFTQSRWKKCRMENCQLRRAVLAEADVAGLSPHRTGFQEVDFSARR